MERFRRPEGTFRFRVDPPHRLAILEDPATLKDALDDHGAPITFNLVALLKLSCAQ